jgi:hypothetical protein
MLREGRSAPNQGLHAMSYESTKLLAVFLLQRLQSPAIDTNSCSRRAASCRAFFMISHQLRIYSHTHSHFKLKNAGMFACMHTYIHTYTHTHTNTHTHTWKSGSRAYTRSCC